MKRVVVFAGYLLTSAICAWWAWYEPVSEPIPAVGPAARPAAAKLPPTQAADTNALMRVVIRLELLRECGWVTDGPHLRDGYQVTREDLRLIQHDCDYTRQAHPDVPEQERIDYSGRWFRAAADLDKPPTEWFHLMAGPDGGDQKLESFWTPVAAAEYRRPVTEVAQGYLQGQVSLKEF
jgi:hypothetical protein